MPPMPAYPAARIAAAPIHDHFARHLGLDGDGMPDTAAIEAMIEAAFWASLRREEGFSPKISLAYVAAEQAEAPARLARPVPWAAQPLTKLAGAVERPGIHLGVWPDGGALMVWGALRSLPPYCL